ncbi:hypothetical protein IOCL1545_000521100 [Leishmania shawi]|uniref:Uncharacterized protein n=2 Tax=Viannia TaxID=37616 RepID=A0ABR3E5X9_9TRYP
MFVWIDWIGCPAPAAGDASDSDNADGSAAAEAHEEASSGDATGGVPASDNAFFTPAGLIYVYGWTTVCVSAKHYDFSITVADFVARRCRRLQ